MLYIKELYWRCAPVQGVQMTKILNRPILDKVIALLLLTFIAVIVYFDIMSFGLIGKILWISLVSIVFINVLFVLFTPIVKIVDSKIFFYSEAVPVLYDFKPQVMNLSEIKSLMISEKLIYPRAIFKLNDGRIVYHGFPSKRKARIIRFISFIKENTEIDIVK